MLGLDNKRASLTLAGASTPDGKLAITVICAKHLPKVDRFGSCDAQVIVELGHYKHQTHIVRGSLDPVFSCVLSFPQPSGSEDEALVLVTIVHVDQSEEVEKVLCNHAEVLSVDPGTLLLRQGERVDRMLILESGVVGVYELRGSDKQQNRRSSSKSGGGSAVNVEIGRISQPGACMAEGAVLTGQAPPLTFVALTASTLVSVPSIAMGNLLVSWGLTKQ